MFRSWHHLHERCENCDVEFLSREGDCWGFMYFTMAGMFGIFFGWMVFFPVSNRTAGTIFLIIMAPLALLSTLPYRKGMAIAIDIFFDSDLREKEQS